MILLAVNAGSSSLKFSVYKMPEEEVIATGIFEKIGLELSSYDIKYNNQKYNYELHLENHQSAVEILLKKLVELKIIDDISQIGAIGHRIVQGGSLFLEPCIINDEVVDGIKSLYPLAPVHNKGAVVGIESFMSVLENVKNVAVFDTTFHQTMPNVNYLYPVPRSWYEEHGVRKYGFHGTSHRFLSESMMELKKKKDINLITCHLGNGCSISAIKDGICIDTSMGFTPLAGVMMGTRTGDIDPSIISYMASRLDVSATEINELLNKESGLKAVSNVSSDFRDIEVQYAKGDENAILAVDMYVRKVINYIAGYYCQLGKVDAICFTAGVGENGNDIREKIIDGLAALNIYIDKYLNENSNRKFAKISSDKSLTEVYVLPTNEELLIARDTYHLVEGK